jgi:hypothetical protein
MMNTNSSQPSQSTHGSASANGHAKEMKTVYAITERAGRSYWNKIGVGFVNRDGSVTLKLDAVPLTGTLQVRDYDPLRDAGDGQRARAPRAEQIPVDNLL